MVDTANNTTDVYTWNDDGTLASFPGPGYTREMAYNEDGQMLSITLNQNGTRTLAYEYAYGWDGGRRSRKDYINNVWTRFPCGVACGAGELVEQQSDLTGQSWTTTAQYLNGGAIIRRNDEFHHWDYRGTAGVITDGAGNVLSNDVYDQFRGVRYSSGMAQSPRRLCHCVPTEGDGLICGLVRRLSGYQRRIVVRARRHRRWRHLHIAAGAVRRARRHLDRRLRGDNRILRNGGLGGGDLWGRLRRLCDRRRG